MADRRIGWKKEANKNHVNYYYDDYLLSIRRSIRFSEPTATDS